MAVFKLRNGQKVAGGTAAASLCQSHRPRGGRAACLLQGLLNFSSGDRILRTLGHKSQNGFMEVGKSIILVLRISSSFMEEFSFRISRFKSSSLSEVIRSTLAWRVELFHRFRKFPVEDVTAIVLL